MNKKTPKVIAIAAISGGGKTTITSELNNKLQNSKTLFFDDYDFDGPDDIVEWIDNGGDPNEWDLTPLIQDIKKLLMESLDYIILDFPFAYLHSETHEFIDFTVFIDTPLDVAMARRIIRDFKNSSTANILADMEHYIIRGRRGYLDMLQKVKPNSDLIVDGASPAADIVDNITQHLSRMGLPSD